MTTIIDGKAVRDKILETLKEEVQTLEDKPCLAVILAGEDPASRIYVNTKQKTARNIGFRSIVTEMSSDVCENELLNYIDELNKDDNVHAILVQLPLPGHIDTKKVIEAIHPLKDVDCFHPYNAGKVASDSNPYIFPCTPKGIVRLIQEYNIPVEGKNAVVVGRSNIVGRPMAQILTNMNATVTLCHSKTENLDEIVKNADIIVSAVGKPNFIKEIKEGAVVFDVGMNRIDTPDGKKLTGDVDFEKVKDISSYITPVPGGVGPMTICSLILNTYDLYKLQKGL